MSDVANLECITKSQHHRLHGASAEYLRWGDPAEMFPPSRQDLTDLTMGVIKWLIVP